MLVDKGLCLSRHVSDFFLHKSDDVPGDKRKRGGPAASASSPSTVHDFVFKVRAPFAVLCEQAQALLLKKVRLSA
jgi:hypothetical protein